MSEEIYILEVTSGKFIENGRTYNTGDVFMSRYPWHKKTVNGFRLAPEKTAINADDFKKSGKKKETVKPALEKEETPTPAFDFEKAEDVSEQFPESEEKGLLVFKCKNEYAVAKNEEYVEDLAMLHNVTFSSKTKVKAFLESYVPEKE